MTLEEIKAAHAAGKTIHCGNSGCVIQGKDPDELMIVFTSNGYAIGLTHRDGVTMNGKPEEFFIAGEETDEIIDCVLCLKEIWFRDSYSPHDDAIRAECDTEVTGRKHPPSLDPKTQPPPPINYD